MISNVRFECKVLIISELSCIKPHRTWYVVLGTWYNLEFGVVKIPLPYTKYLVQ